MRCAKAFLGDFLSVALVILGLGLAQPAQAQEAANNAPSVEELEKLVSTLEDEKARGALVSQLQALIAAQRAGAPVPVDATLGARMLDGISAALGNASDQFAALISAAADLPALASWVRGWATNEATRHLVLTGTFRILIVLGAAAAGLFLMRRIVAMPLRRLEGVSLDTTWTRRILFGFARGVLEILGPLALVGAAYLAMALVQPLNGTRIAAVALVTAFASWQIIAVLADVLLAPNAPRLRWLRVGDETAAYLTLWLRRLALVAVFGFFIAETATVFGLPSGGHSLLVHLTGLVLATLCIVIVLQNRHAVSDFIRGRPDPELDFDAAADQATLFDEPDTAQGMGAATAETMRGASAWLGGSNAALGYLFRRRLADIWHLLAIGYLIAAFAVWALTVDGGFTFLIRSTVLSALVVALALLLLTVEARGIRQLFHIGPEMEARFPGLERRANRYVPVLRGLLRGLILAVTLGAILQIWGVGVVEMLSSNVGRRVTSGFISIVLAMGIGVAVWEFASGSIERYLSAKGRDGRQLERSARVKTLLPLVRSVVLVMIVIVVALIMLSELGVNIAPLLAGAGVIGLAIGFGSQKLVQDIINGAFILVEDALSVGDVVQVAGKSGVVEAFSIRSIRLRDATGTVHVIPFSAVDQVSNLTKEFSYYMLDIGVAYREDTDEVSRVCIDIVEEMRADPQYGPFILEPLEVLGVDAFLDSAVLIKARIKTMPIKQWMVGREFNRRMKKRFDQLGIEIPFPHQTIYFGEDKQGKAPPARILVDATQIEGPHSGAESAESKPKAKRARKVKALPPQEEFPRAEPPPPQSEGG